MRNCCVYIVASNDTNFSAFEWPDENLALACGGTQVPVTRNDWWAELLALKLNEVS